MSSPLYHHKFKIQTPAGYAMTSASRFLEGKTAITNNRHVVMWIGEDMSPDLVDKIVDLLNRETGATPLELQDNHA